MSCNVPTIRQFYEDDEVTGVKSDYSPPSPLSDFASDGEDFSFSDDETYQVDEYEVFRPSDSFGSEEDAWFSHLAVQLAHAALTDNVAEKDAAMDAVVAEIAHVAVVSAVAESPPDEADLLPAMEAMTQQEVGAGEASTDEERPRGVGSRGAARRQQRIFEAECAASREEQVFDCVCGLLDASLSGAVGRVASASTEIGPPPFPPERAPSSANMAELAVVLKATPVLAPQVAQSGVSGDVRKTIVTVAVPPPAPETVVAPPTCMPIEPAEVARPLSRSSSRSSGKISRQAEPGEFDQPVKRMSKSGVAASAPALRAPSVEIVSTNHRSSSVSSRTPQQRTRSESRGEGHIRHHRQRRRSVFAPPMAPRSEPPAPPAPPPPSASKPPAVAQPLRRQLREARGEAQHTAFRMDLSDIASEQQTESGGPFRESSLVRGYEALGVEIHALDGGSDGWVATPSAPRTQSCLGASRPPVPSAMEMDLGLAPSGRLASPATKTRKKSGMEQSPQRAASLGTTRVTKSSRGGPPASSQLLSLPSLHSKASPVVLQPLSRGKAHSHRAQDPLMTFSLGSSKARWGSVSSVF